ncbi:glycosyltransferase [Nostoc sp. 2RC]|uniref:glycosyltransferase n=1 Tax=Nostoc sp. 2RC TaxID=2485484 RepID=UPI00162A1623|nr:glycosyltransferase [Nostoc sp. 2RC]MBC1240618.1 glycosyltransferase [Nostoc sp. 2RC]
MNKDWSKDYPLVETLAEEGLDQNHSLTKMFNLIADNQRVVDFGCATGYFAKLLNKKGCIVTGVDINPNAAKLAEQYCKEVIVADLDFVSVTEILPSHEFDVAVFGDVLEHLRNPWKILEDTKQILKKDGYVIASIPNIAHGAIRLSLLQGRFEYTELGILDNTHLRFFTRKTVEELFERPGYLVNIVDQTQIGIFSDNPLIPKNNRAEFNSETIKQIEEDRDAETLQFIIRAEPCSIEAEYPAINKHSSKILEESRELQSQLQDTQIKLQQAQAKVQENQLLLQELQFQLQDTQTQLEHSQFQLQDTQAQLEHSQFQLQDTQAQLEHSQFQLQDTQAQLEHSQFQLQDTQAQLEHSQFQLQDTQAQLEHSQFQLQDTQAQLEHSQFQLQDTQAQLEHSQFQLQDTQAQLERSQSTIIAMSTSKFWRMRKIWFRFRHVLGSLDDENSFDKSLWIKFKSATNLIDENSLSYINFLSKLKNLWFVFRTKGLRYCLNKLREKTSSKLNFDDLSLSTIPLPGIPQTNDLNYQKWLNQNYPTETALQKMVETAKFLAYQPTISVIMPVFNTPEVYLRAAIESVLNQAYPRWELCIADDYSTHNYIREILEDYSLKDSRIKVIFRTENGHISSCSNSAIEIATGEFIALLDHDDLLTPDALYETALLLNKHPEADMIYSDEDKIDDNRKLQDPFFKPDWCPDSFLSRMYTCHLGIYRRDLVNAIGGFRVGYEGSQDYDLVLRLTEKTTKIFHIPKILYHWRIHPQSAASKPDQKPYAVIAAEKALVDALARRGEDGRVTPTRNCAGHYIIRYTIKDYKLVSIIIPTRDLGDILDKCLTSIFDKTTYPNYEVILIDNGSQEENTANVISKWKQKEFSRFKCYRLDIPFNYSRINNYAVNQAKGDYLLFLNNDIEVITPDWIDAMVEQAQRPSIGAVGALLLYPDNTIQHAGVIMGIGGVAGHSHKYYPADSPGYFDQILTVNNYSAVTAACLMCRREIFEAIGGFEQELKVAFNDVDFCLKVVEKGYKNIYLPHVLLYHYESKSRGHEDTPAKQARFMKEIMYMQNKWKEFMEHDPCYSPHLSRQVEDFSIRI